MNIDAHITIWMGTERKGRLQAEEDRDLARKVIVQLQEEIWSLKKGRMVSWNSAQ